MANTYSKLNKYGVPISHTSDERQAMPQPKFSNRFRVFFENLGTLPTQQIGNSSNQQMLPNSANAIITSSVESFHRPLIDFANYKVTSFIGYAQYVGRPQPQTFTITLRDEISNTLISYIYNQLKKQIYRFQPATYNTSSQGSNVKSVFLGADTRFNTILEIMDGRTNYTCLEQWYFGSCQIISFQPKETTYENDSEIITMDLTCSFNYMDVTQPSRTMFNSTYAKEESTSNTQQSKSNNRLNTAVNNLTDTAGKVVDNAVSNATKDFKNYF